jgi:hypothetical protein
MQNYVPIIPEFLFRFGNQQGMHQLLQSVDGLEFYIAVQQTLQTGHILLHERHYVFDGSLHIDPVNHVLQIGVDRRGSGTTSHRPHLHCVHHVLVLCGNEFVHALSVLLHGLFEANRSNQHGALTQSLAHLDAISRDH